MESRASGRRPPVRFVCPRVASSGIEGHVNIRTSGRLCSNAACRRLRTPSATFFHDFLYAAALCLVIATVLTILGAILSSWTFSPISTRDRIELISQQGANVGTAAFLLGAVAALFPLALEHAPRARPILIAALMVGAVIALLALYSIVNIATVHLSTADGGGTFSFGLAQGGSLKARLGTIAPQVGVLLVVLVAMVGANRAGDFFSGSRGI